VTERRETMVGENIDRTAAWTLLTSRLKTANIVKHALATEAAMRAVAARLGEDEALWALTGLVHDLDYEETAADPGRHGRVTAGILTAEDYPATVVDAVLAHNHHAEATTAMARALLAVDPATGFIVAAALMHPARKLGAVDVPFLEKRFREKRFAAGASREQMATCASLGISREEFLGLCLGAMQAIAGDLGL
jgi:putative nucleotidyltransferase with HDIG domain